MPVLPRGAFADRLASLPAAALRALVADAWAARGYETSVDGTVVVAEREGERTTVFPCASRRLERLRGPARPPADASVDVVVDGQGAAASLATDLDARYVGPDDLYNVLLYGIDRDRAERLLDDHLDAAVRVDAETAATFEGRSEGTADRGADAAGSRVRRALDRLRPAGDDAATLVALAAVVTAGLVLGLGPGTVGELLGVGGGTEPGTEEGAVDATTETGAAGATGAGGATDAESTAAVGAGGPGPLGAVGASRNAPPGVDPRLDELDVNELVAAHADALDERSYRWTARLDRSEAFDDDRWELVRWQYVVESDDRYLTNATGVRVDDGEAVRSSYDAYADGEFEYRRIEDEDEDAPVRYERSPLEGGRDGTGRPQSVFAIDRYLGGENVSVTRLETPDETVYRVTVEDAPAIARTPENVSDYRATAYVTEEGFVARLDVEYVARTNGETGDVRYGFDFDDVGNATVGEPAWIEEARERADAGDDGTRRTDPSSTPVTSTNATDDRAPAVADGRTEGSAAGR